MSGARALLLAALPLAACGEPAPPYTVEQGDRVTLTVQIGERLVAGPTAAAKELRFALDGRVGEDGAVDARILWLELDHGTGERLRTVTSGVEGEVARPDADTLELARTRLLGALRDRPVRIVLAPEQGLTGLEGLTLALAAAWRDARAPGHAEGDLVAAAVDDVALPLEDWFHDERLLRLLQAAGLSRVPAALLEKWGTDTRSVPVHLPGRGDAAVRVTGRTGVSGDGRPAVRLEGHGTPDLAFSGPPGPAPPPEIGAPDPASVVARVETEYAQRGHRPIRGHADVSFAYEGGYRVHRSTGFTLVIAP